MSKKPNQLANQKVSTSTLLPTVFQTSPNQKMLSSTLDAMSSKGQVLLFDQTFGLRSAAEPETSFFAREADPVREESQTNTAFVITDDAGNYTGKSSYLDISNYFNIQGLPLLNPNQLDNDPLTLDLPINNMMLSNYQQYYWLPVDLPIIELTFEQAINIDSIVGLPYATIVDRNERPLVLADGMRLVFFEAEDYSGTVTPAKYKSTDTNNKLFYVTGVGTAIELIDISSINTKIPQSVITPVPWDNSIVPVTGNLSGWGGAGSAEPGIPDGHVDSWDATTYTSTEQEYIVIERYSNDQNPWTIINKWYHIGLIKYVAHYLELDITTIITSANQAQRPIIQYLRNLELANWPKKLLPYDIQAYFAGQPTDVTYTNKAILIDNNSYTLTAGDRVIFNLDNKVYQAGKDAQGNFTFTSVTTAVEFDSVMFVVQNNKLFQQLIYTSPTGWSYAQNKITKNQAPIFEFYNVNDIKISAITGNKTTGGVMLDFLAGNTYDSVLERKIAVSNIDFDIVQEINPRVVSSNQIRYRCDADAEFTVEDTAVAGPYQYKIKNSLINLWNTRSGLDITADVQTITYSKDAEEKFTSPVLPNIESVVDIHIFPNGDQLKLYFNLNDRGYVQFSSCNSQRLTESFLPLISGRRCNIVCHNLPYNIAFHRYRLSGNATTLLMIEEPYCFNNNISNGTITLDLTDAIVDNDIAVDLAKLAWTYNNSTNSAVVRPEYKWRFLFTAYYQDKTYPIYHDYDFTVGDITNGDGSLDYKKSFNATNLLNSQANNGDKIIIESTVNNAEQRTAPSCLVKNPLNEALGNLNYYSLYQHATDIYSGSAYTKEIIDTVNIVNDDQTEIHLKLTNGTLTKHNNPLPRFAVMANNLPFDFADILIKQGRHYDAFVTRLTSELQVVINTNNQGDYTAIELLSKALEQIYFNRKEDQGFWYHSNMIGWGTALGDSVAAAVTINSTGKISLGSQYKLEPINYTAGNETCLHIVYNKKILHRNVDYKLTTSAIDGYYTDIEFVDDYKNRAVYIRQWNKNFNSRIPASLAKIGLAPMYMPEILRDPTDTNGMYFIHRHDGTRYCLQYGIQENDVYPADPVEQLLWEYEKAVWSSISYDIENNDHSEYFQDKPGGFRGGLIDWTQARGIVNSDIVSWLSENNLYILKHDYDSNDGFTYRYMLGSGDGATTITGSWRTLYRYFYDTDRPHTHPWEMLGYTLKPSWWDTHYSWIDPSKRILLEKNLRLGNRFEPPVCHADPTFARVSNPSDTDAFPVDTQGKLISPKDLPWLASLINIADELQTADWIPGELSPWDLAFLNTQRGLASEVKLTYLLSTTRYVANNWLPGSTVRYKNLKLNKNNKSWITTSIDHAYHRSDAVTFTAGIESLYSEFCYLNNVNFSTEVAAKFNNLSAKKEFLLQGFSNKNNVRIQSTSIANQSKNLFIPEENYAVRTVKHYPHLELFYSAMRIIWDGSAWIVFGFTNEQPYFNYHVPKDTSPVVAVKVNDTTMKEKTSYDFTKIYQLPYGSRFTNRQELYDFIIGYGVSLTRQGFVFEEPEAGDIRNWQLSAKQYIFWSNDTLAAGNYIDLNPAADAILLFADSYGQLENLTGNNSSPGWCIDRYGKNLFSKDLLVQRDSTINISTKDRDRSIYGIKLTFAMYESVVHLDGTSVFNDVYFLPNQGTTKRSFKVGGKKSYDWDGKYFVYGYMFSGDSIIPNYDSYAEQGRSLLDIESSILDPDIINASRSQFGLNRNPELRQLFLTDDVETQFKNSITFNKGTINVFISLEPLTHKNDDTQTVVNQEYMIRLGEFGNTDNIEYYEFQLRANDINNKDYQLIKFSGARDDNTYVIGPDDWVHTPYDKPLKFTAESVSSSSSKLKISGPIMPNDTDYAVSTLKDIPYLYKEFEPLYTIKHYDETISYKKDDQVRKDGQLYIAKDTVPVGTGVTNAAKFKPIDESYLPNIFVENYNSKNPNLAATADTAFTPGTWQVIQTVDRNIAIVEVCTGLTDATLARVTTNKDHKLAVGDLVLLVNANTAKTSVNGIWPVKSLEDPTKVNGTRQFYIDTRITETIKTGKMFTFKPVRFKDVNELKLATEQAEQHGYAWKSKFNPAVNQVNTTPVIVPPLTTSGFSSVHPLAIVDNNTNTTPANGVTYDYGRYAVYSITSPTTKTQVKEEKVAIDPTDIEHLVIYNHDTNETLATIEMFNPKRLIIPQVFLDEIDVINRVDPAKYSRTTDKFKTVYISMGWYNEWIGRRWWDISTIQFADYESFDNDLDKYNNWGKTVNNKLPDIYEWTKSPVPPNQWNKLSKAGGDAFGTPASGEVFVDNSSGTDNYHWVEEQQQVNGNIYTAYYFWVKNKNTIAKENKLSRVYSCNVLSKIVLNPSAVGMSWWAPIGQGSLIIKGIKSYLNNTSTVVQIKKKTKGNEKNQQWLFVADGDQVRTIPEWMHIRLRNSLSTVSVNYNTYTASLFEYKEIATNKPIRYYIGDVVYLPVVSNGVRTKVYWQALNVIPGTRISTPSATNSDWKLLSHIVELSNSKINVYSYHAVPDRINLHPFNLLGNDIRPYQQSWFADYSEARRVFIQQANLILKNMDVINGISGWDTHLQANLPFAESIIDMSEDSGLWYRTDFTTTDYNPTKTIADTVTDIAGIFTADAQAGDYIKVIDSVNESTSIYEKLSDDGYSVVYRELGTIQFSDALWKKSGLWDGNPWDTVQWDYDLSANVACLVDIIRNDLFVAGYQTNYNKLMCVMLRYVLSEQPGVNWLQKSSTVEPLNLISQSLDPLAELERDNISTLTEFYSNVKAYRDKLRDSNIVKSSQEPVNTEIRDTHDITIKLHYNRHNIGTYDLPTIANTEFSKMGWDPTTFDPTSINPDFTDSTFNPNKDVIDVVLDETDVYKVDAAAGNYIRFNNQENNSYTIYEKLNTGSYKIVYISDYLNYIITRGYDSVTWDSFNWDGDLTIPSSVTDPDHDAMLWDTFGWDIDQSANDIRLEKIYTGGANATEIVTGSTKSKYYRPVKTVNNPGSKGEELVDVAIPHSLTIDVTSLDTNNTVVRSHYYKNSVEMFIADSTLTELKHNISKDTMRIEFTNMIPLLNANLDDIQYVWVGSEKIGYTIKTGTYISGLIRSVDGTPLMDHDKSESVYIVNATTLLVPQTPLQNLHIKGPFFNDSIYVPWDSDPWETSNWDNMIIKTLEDSVNPFAQAIKNYVSS